MATDLKTLPPLALYVHFPWCVRKCPYCDFNSHTLRTELPEEAYIDRLLLDLAQHEAILSNRPLMSIFMGGGTPSLFSPAAIGHLLAELNRRCELVSDIEITLEANPNSVEQQRFAGYRAAGINRLSIGIQSFQQLQLQALGRVHSANEAQQAMRIAHQTGFTNFNIDLMHGLPQQTVTDALEDLQIAIELAPTHLSWYQLTLEPNTLFAAKPPQLPDEEVLAEIQAQGHQLLQQADFYQYEISAYSKTGYQARHNENYWQFGDYLGIGAGAHSKLTDLTTQSIYRCWKVKNPKDYLNPQNNFMGDEQWVSAKELPFEFMLNALRLYRPIPLNLFTARTGLSIDTIRASLVKAEEKGLLSWNENFMETTALGKQFYNDLVGLFIAT